MHAQRSIRAVATCLAVAWSSGGDVRASFTSTTDEQAWLAAVPSFTTLDFVLGGSQPLGEQYASLGVHFPDGDDWTVPSGAFEDLWGAKGGSSDGPDIHLVFDDP